MRALFIMYYFEMRNGLQCASVVNNGLRSASMNRCILNIIRKMVQILQEFLVLGRKQGGTLKLVNHKHEDWASIQLLTLPVLNKQTKEKLENALSAWKNFRKDLTWWNGKYLSIFLGLFARIVKVTYFVQVINFRERSYEKIHPHKIDKNNRDSTFSFFWSHACMILFYNMKSNLYNVFLLKYVSNVSIDHYMESVIR